MRILLHICCAVCAGSTIEQLKNEGWDVTGFFYNPNIHPEQEYIKRFKNTKLLLSKMYPVRDKIPEVSDGCLGQPISNGVNVPLIEGTYDKESWFKEIKGFEEEKEGGKRCQLCFEMRLKETFKEAKKRNIPYFTTTLTISPHKNSKIINSIGHLIGKDSFIAKDFKKKDGFKRALQLSKEYNLYHQNYCGCIFSMPNVSD